MNLHFVKSRIYFRNTLPRKYQLRKVTYMLRQCQVDAVLNLASLRIEFLFHKLLWIVFYLYYKTSKLFQNIPCTSSSFDLNIKIPNLEINAESGQCTLVSALVWGENPDLHPGWVWWIIFIFTEEAIIRTISVITTSPQLFQGAWWPKVWRNGCNHSLY